MYYGKKRLSKNVAGRFVYSREVDDWKLLSFRLNLNCFQVSKQETIKSDLIFM